MPIEVARVRAGTLRPGQHLRIDHPPFHVLLVNVEGEFFAIEDACPHSGWSLSLGRIRGHQVVCPGHGWLVDVRDGCVKTAAGFGERGKMYRTEIDSDDVVVFEVEP